MATLSQPKPSGTTSRRTSRHENELLRRREHLRRLSSTEAVALQREAAKLAQKESCLDYKPYWKQALFHAYGRTKRERLLRAGNQQGKTYSAGAECAYHLTGLYPSWWRRRRFKEPPTVWASGVTGVAVRSNAQRVLLGDVGRWGQGAIPSHLLPLTPGTFGMATGVPKLFDYVLVKHVSGGYSTLRFLFYSQDREKWQGPPIDVVWFDEEPPYSIYSEGLSRTNATGGLVMTTFTPLLGQTEVVDRFLLSEHRDRADVNMVITDALHMSEEQRQTVIDSYEPWERDARLYGIPVLGSGRVFPLAAETVMRDERPIPSHWRMIAGIDFGWTHPTAAVKLAHDPDNDIVYVVNAYRKSEMTPAEHSLTLRTWGKGCGGLGRTTATRRSATAACRFRGSTATTAFRCWPATRRSPAPRRRGRRLVRASRAGVTMMLDRMKSGRLKVFRHLEPRGLKSSASTTGRTA